MFLDRFYNKEAEKMLKFENLPPSRIDPKKRSIKK
jgi:hypothetical protein